MTVLPAGKQWAGYFGGRRARLRNLRHACQRELRQEDPEALVARARATVLCESEQHPEFALLLLLYRAVEIAASTEVPWPQALDVLVDAATAARTRSIISSGDEEGA